MGFAAQAVAEADGVAVGRVFTTLLLPAQSLHTAFTFSRLQPHAAMQRHAGQSQPPRHA